MIYLEHDIPTCQPILRNVFLEPVLAVQNEVVDYLRQLALIHPNQERLVICRLNTKGDVILGETLFVEFSQLFEEVGNIDVMSLFPYIAERWREERHLLSQ